MTSERWQRVERLCHAALDRDASQRASFLDAACAGDESLRQEVELLLAREQSAEGFLAATAFEAAAKVMVEDAGPSLTGRQLGTYEVLSLLGAGGMGEVYRARDTKLNRDVALKILPDPFALDVDRLARFKREARAVAALNHPHIVTIFSIEEHDDVPFMTMELIEGCTLDQGIPGGGLSLARFFDIAIALADALSAAHRKHIIHRDLKPANVMVTDDGRVKVLDFGLARTVDPDVVRLGEAVTSLGLTAAGTIVGTMAYMSPEQIEAKPLDHRTDLFSLGIILYELATGERPFRGDSPVALMSSILKDHPKPVGERRSDLPGDVRRLIDRCLEKEPRDRIQTANEMLVELKAQRRAWESGAGGAIVPAAPTSSSRPTERTASIAVLAFADMSAAKDQDWFCDGIAEEILNALTPLKGLRVAARTSAFSFKGKGDDLRTIGEKLNVTTVLEGSVRRAGDRVRITAQLSNVANGFQLWSERYDRELKDIFDVQDEIAKAIVERLRVTLGGGNDVRLVEQATTNIEAYQLYLKGRALVDRRGANVPAGLDLLRKALELDPGYSLAWAGLADALTVMAYSGAARGSESKAQAMAAARRSVELDPASAVGHTSLANATLLYENNRAVAKQRFERALELNPGHAMGRCWYGLFYLIWARGDFERGIAEARRALDSDPLSAYVTHTLGVCLFTAGRLDEAIEMCRRAIQLDPESFVARWALGIALGMAGRFEEAVSTLDVAAERSGRHTLAVTGLAGVFGQGGKPAEALVLHRELMDRASRGYVSATHLALTADAAGHRDEAMAFARRAWDEREPSFILWARQFPQYRALHSDPRFAAILREMDSPEVNEGRRS
jgi:serine/threonine protein kinase/tetratricopeptide (TPR) repeat protein